MRRVLVGAACAVGEILVPVSVVVLPVGEPCLLGVGVHRLEVEGSVVSDECLEALVVVACEVVDREAAEAGTNAAETILVDVRQVVGSVVDSREIVVHALACPVARHSLVPLRAVARQTAAVRSDDDIVVSRHYLEVPAVAPELAYGALRSALAEEQCRILLVRVEVWRQYYPYLHLLAVGSLHPALLHLAHLELVVERLVLEGELLHLCLLRVLAWCDDVELVSLRDAVARSENLARVAEHLERTEVHPVVGELANIAVEVGLVHVYTSVPAAYEVEIARVGRPAESVYVRVEHLGHVSLLAGEEIVYAEAVAVALVSVALHRLPSHVLAIGRELRVGVVAHVIVGTLMVEALVLLGLCRVVGERLVASRLAEVLCLAGLYIVEIYVRVGRSGVVYARLLAACVGYRLRVGAPSELLCASERCHRALERFALDDVCAVADAIGSDVSHEGVSNGLHVVVPVAVVEVGDETTRSQRQVVGVLLDALVIGERLDENHLLFVGREDVALDIYFRLGELSAVSAVGVHRPELSAGEERDALAAINPCSVGFACCGSGK